MYTGRVYSRTTLSSLPETLQTTALPSSLLLTRGYNGYLLAYFRISFCARHTLRMRIPSYRTNPALVIVAQSGPEVQVV